MRVGLKESNFIETSPEMVLATRRPYPPAGQFAAKAGNLPLTNSWRRLSFFRQ